MNKTTNDVKIINLTPHDVNIIKDGKVVITYPKSGVVARVKTQSVKVGEVNGVDIRTQRFESVEGLPTSKPNEKVLYIVSMAVRMALPVHVNLISPDTSPEGAVRNEKGQIIGVTGFVR